MSGNVTALLVAIAGVLGTLRSPILTQRLNLRAKQQKIDALKEQRIEERVEERRRTAFKESRDCCIALNTAARSFRQSLKNCLFEGYDEDRTELEQARRVFTGRTVRLRSSCRTPSLKRQGLCTTLLPKLTVG